VQNTIAHGSVADLQAVVFMTGTASLTASYSNYQTTSGTVTDGGHNQTQPPVLVDQANGNFHELPSSPTVDAGIASGFIGNEDLDGNPRNLGGAPDIGAYELPAPTATTGPAHVTGKTATLTGKVNPRGGKVTSCRFSYGRTTSYGLSAPCAQTVGSGTAAVAVSARVAKLRPGTTYHYRLVVVDAGKTVRGSDARFTTSSLPAASMPPSLSATPRAGRPVTCRPGSWTGSPTFAFAWLLSGRTIASAHKASFTPPKSDIGQALQCQVTATNGAGSTHADSAAKVVKK
jgi:hypothetical protein